MKPKYQIGDTVWLAQKSYAKSYKVLGLRISEEDKEFKYCIYEYSFLSITIARWKYESDLHPTKESLIASL